MAYLGGETREVSASSKGDESHAQYQGPIAFWPCAPGCSGRDDGRSARHGGSQAGTQAYRAEFAAACPICGEPGTSSAANSMEARPCTRTPATRSMMNTKVSSAHGSDVTTVPDKA